MWGGGWIDAWLISMPTFEAIQEYSAYSIDSLRALSWYTPMIARTIRLFEQKKGKQNEVF